MLRNILGSKDPPQTFYFFNIKPYQHYINTCDYHHSTVTVMEEFILGQVLHNITHMTVQVREYLPSKHVADTHLAA